jgi:hypothetical protein
MIEFPTLVKPIASPLMATKSDYKMAETDDLESVAQYTT